MEFVLLVNAPDVNVVEVVHIAGIFTAIETEGIVPWVPQFIAATVLRKERKSCSNSSMDFSMKSIPVMKDDKG